jgi:hypothetical protein
LVPELLHEARLEAVMVGNAAAALHGAPVTTLDIDSKKALGRPRNKAFIYFSRMPASILLGLSMLI